MIDNVDIKILNIIQNNGRISNAELARQLDLAPSGVLERVKKLEKKGIISGYEVRLDAEKLGLSITAFIQVLSSDTVGRITSYNVCYTKLLRATGLSKRPFRVRMIFIDFHPAFA